jgi:hypothetical protein
MYVTDSIPENNIRAEEVENMHVFTLQKDIEKLIFSQ